MDTAQEAPLPLFLLGVKLLSFDGVMLSAEVFCARDARVYQVWKAMEGREVQEVVCEGNSETKLIWSIMGGQEIPAKGNASGL